jgi:hypothetical protein
MITYSWFAIIVYLWQGALAGADVALDVQGRCDHAALQTSGLSQGTPRTTLAALVLRCARSLSDTAYRKLFCQALTHHTEGEGKAGGSSWHTKAIPRPDSIFTTSIRSPIYNLSSLLSLARHQPQKLRRCVFEVFRGGWYSSVGAIL